MERAIVIGNSGAGKSTFARALRDVTGLPLHYLDRLWHRPDKTTATREEFDLRLGELLAGERDEASLVPPEVEDVVVDAVAYAETARRKRDRWRWWTFVALTSGCLIAALVLMIVGAAHGSMWAALLVIKCIAFGWAVCYPLLRTEKPVRNTLIIASAGVYPFLCSLGVRDLRALGIVILSAAFAWAVYGIWLKCRNRQK